MNSQALYVCICCRYACAYLRNVCDALAGFERMYVCMYVYIYIYTYIHAYVCVCRPVRGARRARCERGILHTKRAVLASVLLLHVLFCQSSMVVRLTILLCLAVARLVLTFLADLMCFSDSVGLFEPVPARV